MNTADDCVCITGPTACGKTDLALRLAQEFPVEIVSMDSAMVYRGMDIGTAKPSPEIRENVPHHLVDIVEPTETYSAGQFARDAANAIADVRARGRLPLLVGGTLLYLRSLRDGLADLPGADIEIRDRLDREAIEIGWEGLHAQLAEIDPLAAKRIAPGDRQRIQRALEVIELTGEPLSSLHQETTPKSRLPVHAYALIRPDRAMLSERIEQRFDAMVEAGFIDEVSALRKRGDLDATTPSMRAVGYRQIWAYLAGDCTWAEAREKAIVATRRLAKRQMTWLRSDPDLVFLTDQADSEYSAVADKLREIVV